MIVVWFSCGAASAVAAKLTIEKHGAENVRVVNTPIIEEDLDNKRFLLDVEEWLDVKIEFASNPKYPTNSCVDVWSHCKFMSSNSGAVCTFELKKKSRQLWQEKNKPDWHVLGFTFDETDRHSRFVNSEIDNVLPVLIDARLTKQDCIHYLQNAGIELPRLYKLGYPNANCIGCVKATSPTYWNLVRKTHPDVFADRAAQSLELGVKLVRVKNKRIQLSELSPDAQGRSLKSMKMDCGIFCHE